MFAFFNFFKSGKDRKKDKAFDYLKKASALSKAIEQEEDEVKLRGLAFEMKKNHDLAIKMLDEIDYDMQNLDQYYFDPKKKASQNYLKVEKILKNFNNRLA
jgi:predicted aldo/keto reductase-like oxidoreductase